MRQPTLIVIAGPTAVGKTGIAIELAKALDTEIISADSRQCYKGMAIGTAQPSLAELAEVRHHFINCYEVETPLSAADFEQIALAHLQQIFALKNVAIVCGGTGLYIKALCEGLDEMPAVNGQINSQVLSEYALWGMDWLRNAVQKEDPLFFASGETDNPSRMLRALAFVRSNQNSIVHFRSGIKKERPFRSVKIGLELPRELLYERINQRVNSMMAQGLEAEAKQLYPKRQLKNLQTVGYTELFDFFDQKCTLAQAEEKIKQHSRNYAKRQLTWFKKDQDFRWFTANDPTIIERIKACL